MKILIIEDETLLAEGLRTLLELRGFEVETVSDGENGAEYAESGSYDLLILDVMMPGLDGFSLARRVRARRVATPILMLTARGGVQDRIEGLNAGADYYLTKPFDNRELLACVNAQLRRQGAQIVWVSSSYLTDDSANQSVSGGNEDFFLNCVSWLCGSESGISIHTKSLDTEYLTIPSGTASLLTALAVVIIPAAFLAFGIVIWYRRKKR